MALAHKAHHGADGGHGEDTVREAKGKNRGLEGGDGTVAYA